jgi:beta-mannosidase
MATVKCQMSFGWDFAPELPTVGIWDDIALVITGSALIADVFVQPRLAGDHANVTVQLELDSDCEQRVRTVLTVRGKNFDTAEQRFTFDLDLVSGLQMREVAFRLDSPRLWNPWDRGDPNLYTLEVTLIGSSPIDSLTVPCGIRSIELSSDDGGPPWIFVVNGVREFIRGLNWVPADALPGRLRRDDYAALIAMAKSASVNLLRVWGGGLREKRDFYDLCDEAGILVWQEFPFACAFLDHLPRDRDFIDLARRECEAIVRAVRNHPSIVLWCGGNEFSPRRNRELVEAIREAVAANDPDGRPFKPASPDEGESHNWRVWHGFANVRDYRRDETRFASEFGLQAAPAVESLQRFLSLLDLYPPGHAWEYHRAGIKKLLRYAESLRSSSTHDLSGFVAATQKAQAYGLQVAIEHFRRRKYRTGGAIVWQFNEPWPAISWAIVDFYRRPKLAYEKLGELFNPVLVSLDYAVVLPRADDMPEAEVSVINSLMRSSGLPRIPCRCDCRADVWAINDLTRSFDGCGLHISLDDREVHRQTLSLPADSRQRVGAFTCTCSLGGGPNLLRVELRQGDAIISTNSYDLSWCDLGEAGWFNKLYWAVFDRVLR